MVELPSSLPIDYQQNAPEPPAPADSEVILNEVPDATSSAIEVNNGASVDEYVEDTSPTKVELAPMPEIGENSSADSGVDYSTPTPNYAPPALSRSTVQYSGEELSLNFQDIEVRSVLQLLADFTDLNIVVSDSVSGKLTLRLKNVPWDQAPVSYTHLTLPTILRV